MRPPRSIRVHRHGRRKGAPIEWSKIDPLIRAAELSHYDIARRFGVDRSAVSRRARGMGLRRKKPEPTFDDVREHLGDPLCIRCSTLVAEFGISRGRARKLLGHWTAAGLVAPVGQTNMRRWVVVAERPAPARRPGRVTGWASTRSRR